MAWNGLTLTADGRNALNQAQVSNQINFKSVVVGDGTPPASFEGQTGLVHQIFEVTDLLVKTQPDGCTTILCDFPAVDHDYYFREIGITVTTPGGDKLYVYDNCGDDAQHMIASEVESTKKRIALSLVISGVENVTVSTPSVLYVSYDDFQKEVEGLQMTLDGKSEKGHTHMASEITESTSKRFVSDMEKNKWNSINNTAVVTIPVASWTSEPPHTATISVAGLKATDRVKIYPYTPRDIGVEETKRRRKLTALITDGESQDGRMTFYCVEKIPMGSFDVLLEGVSVNG